MNPRRYRFAGVTAAAVMLLGLTACTGDDTDPTPTTSAPTSSSTAPTADPTADATAAAEEALRTYIEAKPELAASPVSPSLDPATVAVDGALESLNALLTQYRSNGWTGTGTLTIDSVQPFSIDLTGDPSADPPVNPNIVFNLCIDASQSGAVDANGQSVVSPDRLDRIRSQITVSEIDSRWIASAEYTPGEPCADS